jgi:hypothetical protein
VLLIGFARYRNRAEQNTYFNANKIVVFFAYLLMCDVQVGRCMKIIRHGFPRWVLNGSVLLLLSPYGWAMESAPTSTVRGRAPAAAPSITGTAAIGGTLSGASGFADADGDSESGTTYSWSGGGASGSAPALVVPLAAGANTITLTVTPKSDAAITDPAEGAPQEATVDIPPDLGRFLKPDTTTRTWSEADTYCAAMVPIARLPTPNELQNLFLSATSSTVEGDFNSEMCTVHDWPLLGQCGGSSSYYWSSTPGGAGTHYYVNLNFGSTSNTSYVIDSEASQVACVR